MTVNKYQFAVGKTPVLLSAATAIKGQGMIDTFAATGKDLLSPDGTMRAKRVTLPVSFPLWTEVDELPPEAEKAKIGLGQE